ncbi:MAG: 6-phosphogluconolactonase [Elusimicrobia bacterium CG_4_9_14_3_um_filter_62_55]|nr:MAG: 6-phosphogluconolactonase [Elusimicrobia bacterium CG22_combo_CG10-13_8_21_14_all_63_91]PJA14224.1 MAG: 6-phosphogluconolactonase [Elusimicrobia bacterium CG_4_10_14_0_2_um_filter_63_34]PJB24603.1 MAG: 6-phosphogluconolactonase [Elusimicrobia bacterium CG_4_9_14_3_um_filter_62_55]
MSADLRIFESAPEAVDAAAKLWAECAHEAARARGTFRIALSGGRTPKALFFLLAKPAFADLPWDRTEFFWGDERYAPISHGESNFRGANDLLLTPVGAVADRIHKMPTAGTDPVKDAQRYEESLRRHFGEALDPDGFPVLDFALQGLGADGHTASLFPEKPALQENVRWVVAARAPGSATIRDRLTLTVPVLRRARRIVFLATGREKAEAVREWLEGTEPPERCPAKLITPLGGSRTVLLDREAADLLKNR